MRLLKGQRQEVDKKRNSPEKKKKKAKKKARAVKRNSKRGRRVLDELAYLEVSEYRQPMIDLR